MSRFLLHLPRLLEPMDTSPRKERIDVVRLNRLQTRIALLLNEVRTDWLERVLVRFCRSLSEPRTTTGSRTFEQSASVLQSGDSYATKTVKCSLIVNDIDSVDDSGVSPFSQKQAKVAFPERMAWSSYPSPSLYGLLKNSNLFLGSPYFAVNVSFHVRINRTHLVVGTD